MPRRRTIETDEAPIMQRQVADMIRDGYSIELVIEHSYDDAGGDQYYLYVKYRNHLRPVYTQRKAHRYFIDFNRAKEWAEKLGFKLMTLVPFEPMRVEELEETDAD